MVSPISSSSRRFCPALDQSISAQRCGSERITRMQCPLSCEFNPFNPDSLKAFDQIVGRGLTAASRWLEKGVGQAEWARRFDAMDRRFLPERDLPLISFETQWQLLNMAAMGQAFPKVGKAMEDLSKENLSNDARIALDKLSKSRALLVEVIEANPNLPYYMVWDAFDPERQYLYVDFGDQEPLEKGALMFGRFLQHERCLYVIPGVFVGTNDVKGQIMEEIVDYLSVGQEDVTEVMQNYVPEVWNICAGIQDERDGVDVHDEEGGELPPPEEPYRANFTLSGSKADAIEALRRHPFFEEVDPPEFGFDPLGESVFSVFVALPALLPFDEFDEESDELEQENESIRIGTVTVTPDTLSASGVNPVELELLKALLVELTGCTEE